MEEAKTNQKDQSKALMTRTMWLNTRVIAVSFGFVCGAVIFTATNWLVIKGGDPVGPHLSLLGQFFWGYKVTFAGSLIGFLYGFIVGAFSGGCIGWIYNKIVASKQRPDSG